MTSSDVRSAGRIALFLIVLGTGWAAWLLAGACKANGGPGFPLDDPWIHLQFARNLHDSGVYAFNRGESATAGSTSPLYTLVLAAGFFVTSDEMILSYALGLFFFALAAFFFFRLCVHLFPDSPVVALAGVTLFLLEPRMQWAALSGMETTMFIAGMLAAFLSFSKGRWHILALTVGILLWIRPEAVLLLLTLGIGALVGHIRRGPPAGNIPAKDLVFSLWGKVRTPLAILAGCIVPYLLMNLFLSSRILPNSVSAKLGYYYPEQGSYFADLAEYFGSHHFIVVAPLALAGIVVAVREAASRKRTLLLVLLIWCAGMIGTFGLKLPYLYQQGRYMMPAIPAVLLLALAGGNALLDGARGRWRQRGSRRTVLAVTAVFALVLCLQFFSRGNVLIGQYAGACLHTRNIQVATAEWIRRNTPGDAVIATHDIGAIGYYGGRRIVDIAGLVAPEFIPYVRQLDSLPPYCARNHVSHLAVLRNWYEVVNVNPLFRSGDPDAEIMEVFPFDSSRIHFVRPAATNAVAQGAAFLRKGDIARAGLIFESAVNLDPLSSRSHLYLGLARQEVGQRKLAEESFRAAIALQPDLWSAQIALAQMEAEQGRVDNGIDRLRMIIATNPDLGPAYTLLADMYTRWKADSLAARSVLTAQRQRNQERRGD